MERLIEIRMGENPNAKKLGELASYFGIKDQTGNPLSKQEYKDRIKEGLIRDKTDLLIVHNAVEAISNQKVKNEIQQKYGELLTGHKIFRNRTYETGTDEEVK